MKHIKKYNESIQNNHIVESIKDYLKPKNIDDIKKSVMNLDPYKKMEKAIQHDFLWLAQDAIKDGFDIKKAGNQYIDMILNAENIEILDLFLDNGFDIYEFSYYIPQLVMFNNVDVLKKLLKLGLNFDNIKYEDEENLLLLSIENNNIDMFNLLIDNDFKFTDCYYQWLDNFLENSSYVDIMKLVIDRVPDIKKKIEMKYKDYETIFKNIKSILS